MNIISTVENGRAVCTLLFDVNGYRGIEILKSRRCWKFVLTNEIYFLALRREIFTVFFETENSSSIPNCLSIKLQGVKGVKLGCGALRIFFF